METIQKLLKINGIIGDPTINEIKIENIVALTKYDKIMDLENLSGILYNSMYEPEQFPGLIYKPFNDSNTIEDSD